MTQPGPRLVGIIPLRNAVKLGYPFEAVITGMKAACDEVIVSVDPSSDDDTLDRVYALRPNLTVASRWDMTNHGGHFGSSEIAKQTDLLCTYAAGGWVLSLQADEMLHEREWAMFRPFVAYLDRNGFTACDLTRLYFYGGLHQTRDDWTVPVRRLFKHGWWGPDYTSGAMQFVPLRPEGPDRAVALAPEFPRIYHYSRIGDPEQVARRIRNLDTFYHHPEALLPEDSLPAYDASIARKLDTYVAGHVAEVDASATFTNFPVENHPKAALELYHHA